MSASSKKKLRNEAAASQMTERQLAEQKEAKKVQLYTIIFVCALVALIAIAAVSGVSNSVKASGVHEKNTIAATVGEHKLSNADLSYYYMDGVNNFSNNYGNYAFMYGLDTTVALDKQVYDTETGETWADNFINQAASNAQAVYALVDAAKAEGFVLPDEQKAQLDLTAANLDGYAKIYGYADADAFIQAQYGKGTSKAGYVEYFERNLLATAYQTAHQESLNYTAEQLREVDSKNPTAYSSFNYNQYYLAASKFLTGGTTDADGNTTYSPEERSAAAIEAQAAAAGLTESVTTVEEFDAAIAALSVNEGSSASSTAYDNQRSSSINSYLVDWITDASRQEGDMTFVPVTTTSTDENGNETENITAYYVVFFRNVNTNETNMINVRHILVSFTGETNEDGTYTDEAKAAAKASAEEILNQWTSGDATEESFAALANEESADGGSNTNGGLYENVYPGQMVPAFNDWCFDASRQAGDTDIVETNYGYHIMYFVGNAEQTYRDFLIRNELVSEDMESWFTDLISKNAVVMGDTQYMNKALVLSR